jgi:acyl-CoA synthetase (NDP forming)
MRSIAIWLELTWAQRRDLLLALVWLPLFALRVRRTPAARLLARMRSPAGLHTGRLADARATARAVDLAAGRLRATCLTRSLVLQRMLAARGITTDLRVGVRKGGQGLEAHAWLECDGVPVNDSAQGVHGFTPVGLR